MKFCKFRLGKHYISCTMAFELPDSSSGLGSPMYSTYEVLRDLCASNAEYFHLDDSEQGQRLYGGCVAVLDHLELVVGHVDRIRRVAPEYDLDPGTPGNGYRSFVAVVDSFVLHCVKLCRQICIGRDSFLFRKGHYMREMETCAQVMASLGTCLQHVLTIRDSSESGSLFPNQTVTARDLLQKSESINQYCFYGRCLGFQFCESIQKILKFITIAMASFSEIYYSNGGMWSRARASLITGSRYVLDPELRARRVVNISQYSTVEFCKSFWLLQEMELAQQLPSLVCPSVAVNRIISIPPEPLELVSPLGAPVSIPIPSAHIGTSPVMVRLLSTVKREGMIGEQDERSTGPVLPPSPSLIIQCHGGGFVAQSSKSHEVYLRDWCKQLQVPILAIDYSLSPEAPYPRALEEVFYAYAWAIKNCHLLGSTAERVVLVGDSAGANLLLGATFKCIEAGVRRPDGLFLAYMPVMVQFVPSPSRLLCLMDPLLPFGFMMRCLSAYTGNASTDTPKGSPDSAVGKSTVVSPTASFFSQLKKELNEEPIAKPPSESDSTESFEEVSEGDVGAISPSKHSDAGSDTLTTITLNSEHSKQDVEDFPEPRKRGSVEYVSSFLQKYLQKESDPNSTGVRKTTMRSESLASEGDEHILFEMPSVLGVSSTESSVSLPSRLGQAATKFAGGIASKFGLSRSGSNVAVTSPQKKPKPRSISLGSAQLDLLSPRSPSEEFEFDVPQDYYLSPYLASDDLLRQMPTVHLLSLQLDPCLDDCVMFARKLRRLGNPVQLDVLDGLPHGFLNFSLVSKEANDGSNLCVKHIRRMLTTDDENDVAHVQ